MSLGRHQPRPLTTRRYLGRQLHPRHLTAVRTTQLMQPIFIHQRLDFRQLHSSGGISGLGHLGSSESMSLRLPNQMEFFTVFFLSPVNGYYTSLVSFSTLSHCHRSWLLGARLVCACPHGG